MLAHSEPRPRADTAASLDKPQAGQRSNSSKDRLDAGALHSLDETPDLDISYTGLSPEGGKSQSVSGHSPRKERDLVDLGPERDYKGSLPSTADDLDLSAAAYIEDVGLQEPNPSIRATDLDLQPVQILANQQEMDPSTDGQAPLLQRAVRELRDAGSESRQMKRQINSEELDCCEAAIQIPTAGKMNQPVIRVEPARRLCKDKLGLASVFERWKTPAREAMLDPAAYGTVVAETPPGLDDPSHTPMDLAYDSDGRSSDSMGPSSADLVRHLSQLPQSAAPGAMVPLGSCHEDAGPAEVPLASHAEASSEQAARAPVHGRGILLDCKAPVLAASVGLAGR